MIKWLVKKGFSAGWKAMFGKAPTEGLDSEKIADAIPPNLEKELGIKISRNWWDSFIDGINRLPRPLMTFGSMYLIVFAMIDPASFQTAMLSLHAMPDFMWYIIWTIVGFWFGDKIISKMSVVPSAKDYMVKLAQIKFAKNSAIMNPPVTTDDFADETKPLSQEQIEKWNKNSKASQQK